MRLIDFHGRVMAGTAERMAAVSPSDLPGATKLDWTVADLIGHLATVNRMCRNSAAGIGPESLGDPAAFLGGDLLEAWGRTRADFTAAFRSPDVQKQLMPTPVGLHPGSTVLTVGTVENLVHGWDLAVALDQNVDLPDDLVAEALGRILTLGPLFEQFRSSDFYAAPQDVDPDALPQDRLLAFLGRAA